MPRTLPKQLLAWLYRVLQPEYWYATLCYQDVSLVLMCYSQFQVRTATYTNEQGTSRLLLKVYGDVERKNLAPPESSSLVYPEAFSVEMWIPMEYPQSPPEIYIHNKEPQPLAPNNYIGPNSRLYHPFLASWTANYGQQTSNDGIPPTRNRLLLLTQVMIQSLEDHPPHLCTEPAAPSLPAKPPSFHSRSPPPVPTRPYSASPSAQPSLQASARTSTSSVDVLTPKLNRLRIVEDEQAPAKKTAPPLLPPNPSNAQLVENIKKYMDSTSKRQLFEELPLKELIPLQNRLLQYTEESLNARNYLDFFEGKLEASRAVVLSKMADTQRLNEQLDRDLQDTLPHFDEHLIAHTPVYNQLYSLVTRVEALSDLLYHLDKLHEKGKISFDRYLKAIRGLAREQCLLKQHVEKLVDICGLDSRT